MLKRLFRLRFAVIALGALLALVSVPASAQEVTLSDQLAFDITDRLRTFTPTTQLAASSVCELLGLNRDLLQQSAFNVLTDASSSVGDTSEATMYMAAVSANAAVIDGLIADARVADPTWVRLFFVGGPISFSGGGEAGGNWIRQGVVRSGGGSGGRRYFCRQRPMGDFRWSSRAS